MSTLNVANITDGVTSVGTEYVVNGSAKAWLKTNYSSGTPIIQSSLNISSIGDINTGQRGVNFTNAMAGGNDYAVSGAADLTSASARTNFTSYSLTASDFQARTYQIYTGDSWIDTGCHLTVDGDLA